MLELGNLSAEQHSAVGKKCDQQNLDGVLTYGDQTQETYKSIKKVGINHHFDSKTELFDFANKIISSKDKVLVKGSRGMQMETIVEELIK